MYKTAFFDLDGTLTESGIGITRSVAFALRKFGIEETDQAKLDRFVGPPLIDSFMRFYGLSYEDAVQAVVYYREYYAVTGIFENRVYDGVVEMLQQLKDHGVRCILATSKPDGYANQILEHFALAEYFDFVAGATMDERRTKKEDVIAYALSQTCAENVVMIGDREHDILGGKKNGLDTIGVLYGYGSRDELEVAGADFIAETAPDIPRFILK